MIQTIEETEGGIIRDQDHLDQDPADRDQEHRNETEGVDPEATRAKNVKKGR